MTSLLKTFHSKLSQLNEQDEDLPDVDSAEDAGDRRVVVLLPGRFQPMHKGHKQVFDDLRREYGNNVYVYTTNDTSSIKSPFTFHEKQLIMTRLLGIPGDKIVQTRSPYAFPGQLIVNPENTVCIFAVSEKDMAEDPRFKFSDTGPNLKRDGSPSFLQKYPGSVEECETSDKHGYVLSVPTVQFDVAGESVDSATKVRELLVGDIDKAREAFFDLYGKEDEEMLEMMRDRIEAKALTLEGSIRVRQALYTALLEA